MTSEVALNDQWSKYAETSSTEEANVGAQYISTKGGMLALGDIELPGAQMCVIIVDAIRENTYYPGRFDPDSIVPPKCYSFGRTEDEMEAHMDMDKDEFFEVQADSCASCPMAEWGSADTGRGKACQNRRRLAIIPAGIFSQKKGSRDYDLEVFDDPEHFAEADMAFLKVPVTSVKEYSKFVQKATTAHGRPPFGVIAHVYLEPDAKTQYKMHFDIIEEVSDELAEIVMARHEEAKKVIEQPYRPPNEDDDRGEDNSKSGLRGLKRGKS